MLSASSLTGAVDFPDFKRKLNTVPVPRLGGVGFFIAFFISLSLKILFLGSPGVADTALLLSGGLCLLLGAADDFLSLLPLTKLIFQSVIALIASAILSPSEPPLYVMIKAFYILLLINALNFIDGLDGLCVGISASSLFFFALSDLLFLNTGMGISAMLLFFALVGFIPFNAYPARLYMGDAGSETLGLSLAVFSISSAKEGLFLTPSFILIPIADVLLAIARRICLGHSPFKADRSHLHHMLLDFGFSHPAAVNILFSASLFLSLISLSVYLFFS